MKSDDHVDELLVEHVRGELDGAELRAVDAHLAACAQCRATRARFASLIDELARTAPAAPPIHWGAYRADLRRRLERGPAPDRATPDRRDWLLRPAPALLAAAMVAVLVYAGWPGATRGPGGLDLFALDTPALASQFDLIARLDVVQRLDLLEDFHVINELDELPEPSKS
jgi:anti-sigma factor RsiW